MTHLGLKIPLNIILIVQFKVIHLIKVKTVFLHHNQITIMVYGLKSYFSWTQRVRNSLVEPEMYLVSLFDNLNWCSPKCLQQYFTLLYFSSVGHESVMFTLFEYSTWKWWPLYKLWFRINSSKSANVLKCHCFWNKSN